MKIYIIWLFGVIIWNYAFPAASPIQDVIVAILFVIAKSSFKKIR